MGILAWISVIDLRTRKIPVSLLMILNLLVLIRQICRLSSGREDAVLIMGGMGVGAVFFLVSRVTKEGIGYGDSWMILILGIYLGVWGLLEVLSYACLLLAAASVVCLSVKKMSAGYTLPFVPFLAAGYLLQIVFEI